MNEQMLVDLMGDIDLSLLENDWLERDLKSIEAKLTGSVQKIKKRVNRLTGILSGIAAMVVVITSLAMLFLRKKGAKFAVL